MLLLTLYTLFLQNYHTPNLSFLLESLMSYYYNNLMIMQGLIIIISITDIHFLIGIKQSISNFHYTEATPWSLSYTSHASTAQAVPGDRRLSLRPTRRPTSVHSHHGTYSV